MHHRYDPLLVALSITVAIAAGYVALDLAGRVAASRGRMRAGWLASGALAMGIGIWSMHFIGMLAFRLYTGTGAAGGASVPMTYDVPHLIVSMVVAIGASAIALYAAGRERLPPSARLVASAALGVAIAGMHYIGMAGLRVPATITHRPGLVVLSIVIAFAASFAALGLAFMLRAEETPVGRAQRLGAGVVIGLGIAGMHYTAMSAMQFGAYDERLVLVQDAVVATDGLGWVVSGATLVMIAVALVGTAIDRSLRARLDLTLRLGRANAELQRALTTAEEASAAKSAFLATMSHELRTPLNAFSGYLQLMEMGVAGPVTGQQQEYLARLQATSRHLAGLINDILDLARIEAGQLTVRSAPVSLDAVMDAAVSIMRPQIESAGLELTEDRTADQPVTAIGDEDRVRQILVNLLSNAVKYNAPAGRIGITWGVTAEPLPRGALTGAGPWVFARVRDTGIGIPADRHETIFEPFTQLESGHTRRVAGTGLGLTISRRLAREMGGDLTVRSATGEGSEFTLWLPASAEAVAQARDALAALGEGAGRGAPPPVAGFAAVGETVARLAPDLLKGFAERLRSDPELPGAARMPFSQLADHHTASLGDVAIALVALEERGGIPSPHLVDSTDIQRYIAELHGIQRSQLGWSEDALRREYAILREELARALERAPGPAGALAAEGGPSVTAARVALRFLELAEEAAVTALRGGRERARRGTRDAMPADVVEPDQRD